MSITTKELDSLKPQAKPYLVREHQPNKGHGVLAFRVLPTGDVDAYFIYYVNRKEKLKKIGRYGVLSLKQIRTQYSELSLVYRQEGDPKEVERQNKLESERQRLEKDAEEKRIAMQGSLGQLIDFYLEDVQTHKSQHHYDSVKKALTKIDLDRNIKANQITKQDIIKILHPIVERGAMILANRTRAYLSTMFKFAMEFDDSVSAISKGVQFFIEGNPVTTVKKPLKEEKPENRYLSKAEIKTVWEAFDSSSISILRISVLKLMLLTGSRLEALSGLLWHEINWEEKYITIPPERSKNGNFWVIPLAPTALRILSDLPRLNDHFVFPANNGIECLRTDSFNKATNRLCSNSGISHFCPRDLRRTFKTLAGEIGMSKEIRDRIQNHSLSDVSSKHYDRYDYLTEKRIALEKWDQFIQRII